MIAGAETLVHGFPLARVDLYEIGGRPRFGEVTFYPQSGYLRMPRRHDLEIGAMWPSGHSDGGSVGLAARGPRLRFDPLPGLFRWAYLCRRSFRLLALPVACRPPSRH